MNIKYGLTAILGTYLISTLGGEPVIMAATIGGTIKVNVIGGDFAGIYTGDFAYDDTHLTKVGKEFISINGGGSQTRPGLLSLNFKFLDFATGLTPVTYTASDVDGFPDNPVLAFENGIPTHFGLQIYSASGKQYFGQFLIANRRIRVSRRLGKFATNGKSMVSKYELKTVRTIGKDGLMFGDPRSFNFALRNGTIGGDGVVTLEINESPPSPVPENASPLASLLGFLGLGGVHLWRKSRKG